jgi:hypothetical protein
MVMVLGETCSIRDGKIENDNTSYFRLMITQVKGAGMIKNRGLTGLSITKNTID